MEKVTTLGAAMEQLIEAELDAAERKAIDSLARYKFQMFGYWAGIWVHLNRLASKPRPSPFKCLVDAARAKQVIEDWKSENGASAA